MGLIASPACECGETTETEFHYLLVCPQYAQQRQMMLNHLSDTLVDHLNLQGMLRQNRQSVFSLLLYGLSDLLYHMNVIIFTEVCKFIMSSGRFLQ